MRFILALALLGACEREYEYKGLPEGVQVTCGTSSYSTVTCVGTDGIAYLCVEKRVTDSKYLITCGRTDRSNSFAESPE